MTEAARRFRQRPAEPPTDEMLASADRVILEIAVENVCGVQCVE